MTTIYGRSGLPDWQAGTASVANGSTAVGLTGANLQQTDPTTGATLWVAGRGDFFTVAGVGGVMIASVTDANNLVLVQPWPFAAQTNVSYAIVRMSVPATGSLSKAVTDLQNTGTDANPDLSRTVDDGTARLKLRLKAGAASIAVGPTGTADGSLLEAIDISTGGVVSFPNGALAPSDWQNNRVINGSFDIWQTGASFTIASGALAYTAEQWLVGNNATGTSVTVGRTFNVGGFAGHFAINLAATGVAVGSDLYLSQKFEGHTFADLQGAAYPFVVSFDVLATTSAGSLTAYVQFATNTSLDDGTFSNYNAGIYFTVPTGAARVSVPLPASALANMWRGGAMTIAFVQNTSVGNMNVTIGAVQLERGAAATPWAPKPIARELADCQRFYSCSWGNLGGPTGGSYLWTVSPNIAISNGGYLPLGSVPFPVPMRASPTMSVFDLSGTAGKFNLASTNGAAGSIVAIGNVQFNALLNGSGGSIGANSNVQFSWSANARL